MSKTLVCLRICEAFLNKFHKKTFIHRQGPSKIINTVIGAELVRVRVCQGAEFVGADFVWGRVCHGPSLLETEMSSIPAFE